MLPSLLKMVQKFSGDWIFVFALFIFQILEQCVIKRIKGLTALWINDRDLLPIISIFRKVHTARAQQQYFLYFLPRKLSTSQRSKCQIVMAFTISLSLVLRTNQDRLVDGYNSRERSEYLDFSLGGFHILCHQPWGEGRLAKWWHYSISL